MKKLPGKSPLSEYERKKIEAFIKAKGVTKCPEPGSDELRAYHIRREEEQHAIRSAWSKKLAAGRKKPAKEPTDI